MNLHFKKVKVKADIAGCVHLCRVAHMCDPIWQVTSRSSEMGFPSQSYGMSQVNALRYIGLYLLGKGTPTSEKIAAPMQLSCTCILCEMLQ